MVATRPYIVLLLVATFAMAACDPGYYVVPIGWEHKDGKEYRKRIGDLNIMTSPVGGLIGQSWVDVDFVIENASKGVVPQEIVLISDLGRLTGELRSGPYYFNTKETAGKPLLAATFWTQQGDLQRILGKSPRIEVSFVYGEEMRYFEVQYEPQ
jgi:hypothetical protein